MKKKGQTSFPLPIGKDSKSERRVYQFAEVRSEVDLRLNSKLLDFIFDDFCSKKL
jgi:hypothetical protein